MKKDISKQSKQELTDAIRQRYTGASKQEKARILDEFVSLTGYDRKVVRSACWDQIANIRQRCVRSASASMTKLERKS